jgi:hypothetical protein
LPSRPEPWASLRLAPALRNNRLRFALLPGLVAAQEHQPQVAILGSKGTIAGSSVPYLVSDTNVETAGKGANSTVTGNSMNTRRRLVDSSRRS